MYLKDLKKEDGKHLNPAQKVNFQGCIYCRKNLCREKNGKILKKFIFLDIPENPIFDPSRKFFIFAKIQFFIPGQMI